MPIAITTIATLAVLIALFCVMLTTAVLLVRLVTRPDKRLDAVEDKLNDMAVEFERMRGDMREALSSTKRTESTLNTFIDNAISRAK